MPTQSSPQSPLSYRDAGVDIDAGASLVERIKPHAKRTLRPEVLAGIGGFGALMELPKHYREPVLVSGTDGVGTKLKLASQINKHDSIGQDLVAMSVNDILVLGAESLFFLDYFACGNLDVDTPAAVVGGIAKTNGERFTTYAIRAEEGAGVISVNGRRLIRLRRATSSSSVLTCRSISRSCSITSRPWSIWMSTIM